MAASLIYAGIGSRETPPEMLVTMAKIAGQLSDHWLLRTGGAIGADSAFASMAEQKEIHLPWSGYNGLKDNGTTHFVPKASDRTIEITAAHHPAWDRLSHGVRKLMCRNTTIVLGEDLASYANMVICWTPGGRLIGGTSHAMRVAYSFDIPVFNLALAEDQARLVRFVDQAESTLTPA